MSNPLQALLFLPRIRVQNANAISSPLTWGFPAPSAFLGFAHALNLRVREKMNLNLNGVGIICHAFEPQVHSVAGKRTKVFALTRNPLNKNGESPPIVEEGRAHLEITLIMGAEGESLWDGTDLSDLACAIGEVANAMRLAGGSILPGRGGAEATPYLVKLPEDVQGMADESRKFRRKLLPGFALVERPDILQERVRLLKDGTANATALDALLEFSTLNFAPERTEAAEGEKVLWRIQPKSGWLVPVPVGYAAISDIYAPGTVANTRAPDVPFRFVESLLGLGQWISPHRIADLRSLLWYHDAQPAHGLYRCHNNYSQFLTQRQGI